MEAAVAGLTAALREMTAPPCSEAQIRFANKQATKVLLVGRLQAVHLLTSSLTLWINRAKHWPQNSDPRPGTSLEGVDTIFRHTDGQILTLRYTNLPMPDIGEPGYYCIDCRKQALVESYQAVDIDGARDEGSYVNGVAGFDLCMECAAEVLGRVSRRVLRGMRNCAFGRTVHVVSGVGRVGCISAVLSQHKDTLVVRSFGTPGMHIFAAAMPRREAKRLAALPTSWTRGGRSTGPDCFTQLTSPDLEATLCTICAESVLTDVQLKGPPVTTCCGHTFHTACIKTVRRGLDGEAGSHEVCFTPQSV